jgi:hypothetical protein
VIHQLHDRKKITRQLIGLVFALQLTSMPIGCSRRHAVKPSDPEVAANVITEVLQQWQDGRTVADVRDSDPPIYVVEDLWTRGYQLTNYLIERPPEVFGTNVRMGIKLRVRDHSGKVSTRSRRYLVTTTPVVTVAQED